jgi:hypothetical protein
MSPSGRYKLHYQRSRRRRFLPRPTRLASAAEDVAERVARSEQRLRRILDSLRSEIAECEGPSVRLRQVFETPRAIYRLELERPDLGYQRTTLLDREALEELLEADEVRRAVLAADLGG